MRRRGIGFDAPARAADAVAAAAPALVTAWATLLAAALPASAAGQAPSPAPTYAADVAPILQRKCQDCHRAGSIGPFPLTRYAEVRKQARRIRREVGQRLMPPWHVSRDVGIQSFENDRGLSDAEIETIVAWVDAGMPYGRAVDLPEPPSFPPWSDWRMAPELGPPDLVVEAGAFSMPAASEDRWFHSVSETGLREPRWVRALEVRPSLPEGRKTLHHVLGRLEQDEEGAPAPGAAGAGGGSGLFMEWAIGEGGQRFPEDAGRSMFPGARIRWEIHAHATGEEIRDERVQLGVWFHPRGHVPVHRTALLRLDAHGDRELDIPPGEVSVTRAVHELPAAARVESFQPHMHMRGKAMSLEAIHPDGRRETLSRVDRYQWRWNVSYTYARDAAPLLEAGTRLVVTAWHDNTDANPDNPDPEQWVGWGARTVDEMAHAWVEVTWLEPVDLARLRAERGLHELHRGRGR